MFCKIVSLKNLIKLSQKYQWRSSYLLLYCCCFPANLLNFLETLSFERPQNIMMLASHVSLYHPCMLVFCFFVLSIFLVSFASTIWSPFCKCSKTCGGGVKIRTRNCPMPSTKKEEKCLKPTVEIQECNKIVCPGSVFFVLC